MQKANKLESQLKETALDEVSSHKTKQTEIIFNMILYYQPN